MAYDHLEIEARWQRYWDAHETFRATRRSGRPKRYVLDMFPYPSGAGLHVGHPEGYTATDIVARCLAHARLRRAAPDGVGRVRTAGRAARDRDRHASSGHDGEQHRDVQAPAQDARLQLRLVARDRHHRSRTTYAGRSGSSCSCSERGLAYQADSARQLVPRARHGARQRRSHRRQERARRPSRRSARRSGSGCCGSPRTPIGSPRISTLSTGREDATAQRRLDRAQRGRRDRSSRVDGHPTRASRLHDAARHPHGRDVRGARARARADAHDHDARARREAVDAYVEAATRKSDLDRVALAKTKTGVSTGAVRHQSAHRSTPSDLDGRLRARRLRHRRRHGRPRARRARLRVRDRRSVFRSSRS